MLGLTGYFMKYGFDITTLIGYSNRKHVRVRPSNERYLSYI